ncbi:hypothetical protein VAD59_19630, partial [Enterobacter hormaechei subsp. xiangfangensis]
KHIKKHTKSLEKNLAKANSTKKAEHFRRGLQGQVALLKMNRREISTLKEGVLKTPYLISIRRSERPRL